MVSTLAVRLLQRIVAALLALAGVWVVGRVEVEERRQAWPHRPVVPYHLYREEVLDINDLVEECEWCMKTGE